MKNLILLVYLVIVSSNVIAAEVPKSAITYISPWTPHVDVKMDTTGLDPEGCGASGLYRIDLINDTGAQAKLSTLLSAFMSDKPVGLSISGCIGNSPKISGIRLYK